MHYRFFELIWLLAGSGYHGQVVLQEYQQSFLCGRRVRYGELAHIIDTPPEELRERFLRDVTRGFLFEVDQTMKSRGFFSMSAIIPYPRTVQPTRQMLMALATLGWDRMRREFDTARQPRNSSSQLALSLEALKVKRAPTVVTAMAVGGNLYLSSSVRAGRISILAALGQAVGRAFISIRSYLVRAGMWQETASDPVLHHQHGNCGEMAVLLRWGASNQSQNVKSLRGAQILTVHRTDDEIDEFLPCRSCQTILDEMRLDWGPISLYAMERAVARLRRDAWRPDRVLFCFRWIFRLVASGVEGYELIFCLILSLGLELAWVWFIVAYGHRLE